jgi:uncharacterized protein YkwD
MIRSTMLLILIALLVLSTLALPAGRALAQTLDYTGCGAVTFPAVYSAAYEQAVIELVNAERARNGNLPPLKRVDPLDRAARYHANDMALDRYFEHPTYDRDAGGHLVEICETWERLATYYANASAIGENIAKGQATPYDVVGDWMASDGHRANILSTVSWEMGMGYAPDPIYGTSWVLDFGRRNNIYPLVINREDDVVTSRNVSLYLYGAGIWSEMRLKNDDNAWGAWQPFQKDVNWTLNDQAGARTVWVELRQGALTYSTSDTIIYSVPATSLNFVVYLPLAIR